MKHTGLNKRQAYAIRKVTGKHFLDWAFLAKKHPRKAGEILANKHNQSRLTAIKAKAEKDAK